jgi:hypothetical protein
VLSDNCIFVRRTEIPEVTKNQITLGTIGLPESFLVLNDEVAPAKKAIP